VLSTSCVTEFPERLEATGDALTPAGDATGVVPGADASVSLDGTPTPDAVSPPTTPPVPDAGPPDPVPDAEVAAVERCNGGDDDGDGLVDEDGDADCRARHRDERPLCRGGRCLTCVVETNEGCPASLACRPDDNSNICAQCAPDDNNCPIDRPYCSPTARICGPCPELAPYGNNQFAQRCRASSYGGVCQFLFTTAPGSVNTCGNLCTAVGMHCEAAYVVETDPPEGTGDEILCRSGLEAECDSERQGDLICDCAQ
jgi:hypothetical protein